MKTIKLEVQASRSSVYKDKVPDNSFSKFINHKINPYHWQEKSN